MKNFRPRLFYILTLSFLLLVEVPVLAATLSPEVLPNFSGLVEESGPAVVNIRTVQKVAASSSAEEDELYKRYFGTPNPHAKKLPHEKSSPQKPEQPNEDDEEISRGVGSGFIFSKEGFILTNAHVVKDADEVFVKLTDRREFTAQIIGVDINTDIAVLKIEGKDLPQVTLGDSSRIKVGEWVIAIGSPFDLDNSISAGIISAKAREIGDFLLLIQTDVAINPGNSGGPLINMQGQVIGINSQIYSRSGGYMGISFAIPINDAIRVANQLKEHGKLARGRIGIYLADVNKDVAKALKLPTETGALVSRIEKGGPADKAKLAEGDIVLKFNGVAIEKSTELRRLSAATLPGTQVNLSIWRKGNIKDYEIVLAELPQQESNTKKPTHAPDKKLNQSLGLEVQSLDEQRKKELEITTGVAITHAEGLAARAGLQPEDLIISINNQDVHNEQEFKTIIGKIDPSQPVIFLAKRENITTYIAIPAQTK